MFTCLLLKEASQGPHAGGGLCNAKANFGILFQVVGVVVPRYLKELVNEMCPPATGTFAVSSGGMFEQDFKLGGK